MQDTALHYMLSNVAPRLASHRHRKLHTLPSKVRHSTSLRAKQPSTEHLG